MNGGGVFTGSNVGHVRKAQPTTPHWQEHPLERNFGPGVSSCQGWEERARDGIHERLEAVWGEFHGAEMICLSPIKPMGQHSIGSVGLRYCE